MECTSHWDFESGIQILDHKSACRLISRMLGWSAIVLLAVLLAASAWYTFVDGMMAALARYFQFQPTDDRENKIRQTKILSFLRGELKG